MKFGHKITNAMYSEWKDYYLNYNVLKKDLKRRTSGGSWNARDEKEFTRTLKAELEKIHKFQSAKAEELTDRIANAEKDLNRLVESYETDQNDGHTQEGSHTSSQLEAAHENRYDEYDDTEESDDGYSLEDRFGQLEETVAILVADVHDLALYSKFNYTGFFKIVKKHDKQTGLSLKPTFKSDFLDKRPFHLYNWDSLIVKLSKLYNLVHTRGHPVKGDSSAGGSQNAFVRQTTKYWVHEYNLVPLKIYILRHLPVLVFDRNKEFEARDAAITSIYFDNEDLELYLGRLEKTEGAEAIRLRWYGDTNVKQIFVERKTHHEDWTGEKSVKARFPIKEEHVNAFLCGDYIMDEEFEALIVKGKKTPQEVESMIQLANEVQYAILERKLQPVLRTFYNRTAFQLPGDARVRISLDTDLTMVREDNWDGRQRSNGNWRRTDIGIDHPFEQLPAEDKERFKYGVLEVKLQTQMGQEPPTWVTELVTGQLVEAVPKFSKFIHGCATLLSNRVDLVPFWLPQMDTDMEPETGAATFKRPPGSATANTSPNATTANTPPTRIPEPYPEPLSEGEEDEEVAIDIAQDEDRTAGLDFAAAAEAISYRQNFLQQRAREDEERERVKNGLSNEDPPPPDDERTAFLKRRRKSDVLPTGQSLLIDPLTSASSFDQSFKSKFAKDNMRAATGSATEDDGESHDHESPLESGIYGAGREVQYLREWRAQDGKKIAVPVRIEPKVYFAAERTFLRWLQFSVVIGSIATVLLNFTKPGDTRGLISAAAFTVASLLSIAYSGSIFVYRAFKLRARDAEGLYYDKFGPTALVIVLFAALAINMILRWSE
ncbi:SPX-domain-containing protein [Ramaria rubella]|nr:SPX-domain-containing protein [Ramaria rubella]